MAGNRIRFLPGTPKASEITCLTLLQGPAGFKSGIGQHVIDAPLWSAGMQMVSSSLVQWEGGGSLPSIGTLGSGDGESRLGVWQCVRLEQKHVGVENNKLHL